MAIDGIAAPKIILRILISFALCFLIFGLSSVVVIIFCGMPTLNDPSAVKPAAVTQISSLLLTLIVMAILGRGNLFRFGFRLTSGIPVLRIVLLSLVIAFPASLLADILNADGKFPTEGFSFLSILLIVFIGASASEELLFRGLIQGYLAPLSGIGFELRGMRISLPVLIPAIIFGLTHFALISAGVTFGAALTIVIAGVVLGIIAGYYREKTGSLLPAILTHMCFNVWGSVADYVMKSQ